MTAVSPEVAGSQVEGTVAFVGEPPAGLRQNQRLSTRLLLEERRGVLKVPRGPFLESGAGRQIYVLAGGLAYRLHTVVLPAVIQERMPGLGAAVTAHAPAGLHGVANLAAAALTSLAYSIGVFGQWWGGKAADKSIDRTLIARDC